MNTAKILQQYILIKPNTLHHDGGHYQALRSLENAPTLITGTGQFITKNVIPNTDSSSMYGTKRAGKASNMSRRNARERRRVKLINMGYETLRHHVPAGIENRKLSKVDTLRSAVDYIKHLQTLLESTEDFCASGNLVGDKEKNTQNIPPTTNQQLPTASLTSSSTTTVMTPPKIDNNAVSGSNKISDVSTNSRVNQEMQKNVVKDEKMFIDLAEWLCNTSSVLHNGNIKIEGIDT